MGEHTDRQLAKALGALNRVIAIAQVGEDAVARADVIINDLQAKFNVTFGVEENFDVVTVSFWHGFISGMECMLDRIENEE